MRIKKLWRANPLHYIRDYKFNSLFIKNFISIFLVAVVPLTLLVSIVYGMNEKNIESDIMMENRNQLTRIASELDAIWLSEQSAGFNASFNPHVQDMTRTNDKSLTDQNLRNIKNVQNLISATMRSNPLTDFVMFYFHEPEYYVSLQSAWSAFDQQYDTYKIVPYAFIRQHFNDSVKGVVSTTDQGILFYRNIFRSAELKGAVLLRINYTSVRSWLAERLRTDENRLLIIDQDMYVLFDSDLQGLTMELSETYPELTSLIETDQNTDIVTIENDSFSAAIMPSNIQGWQYVLLHSLAHHQTDLYSARLFMVLIFALGIFVSVIAAWKLSLKFYRPIEVILNLLEKPDASVIDRYDSELAKVDELGFIATLIQQSQFQKLMLQDELKTRQNMLKKAQNVALQAQINPHFIYNTLESINWKVLAHFKQENDISNMLNDFAQLMRLTLQVGDGLIPVRKEIEHAKLYLKLQNARFRDKINVTWDIDDEILDFYTPCLILQPLLENSIYHGVKKIDGIGHISIKWFQKDDHLEAVVADNGSGISPEILTDLKTRLTQSMLSETEHIGLCNVNQRIQLTFGSEWGITIDNDALSGTIIKITLPKVKIPPDLYSSYTPT